jgi:hypothetical protein
MDSLVDGSEREDTGDELPKGMERRLVLRLLSYWRSRCRDASLPSFADIDPVEMHDMWASCFVLDVLGHEDDPVFRAIGDDFADKGGAGLVNRRVSETEPDSLPRAAVSYIDEVIAKGVPISRGGEYDMSDGTKVLFRSIVLPMSDDGETISGLLCAANCREVPPEES